MVASIRPRASPAAAASSFPRSTAFPTDRSMRPRPAATSSSDPSTNVTRSPALAHTSTMPDPIRPAPTTPT